MEIFKLVILCFLIVSCSNPIVTSEQRYQLNGVYFDSELDIPDMNSAEVEILNDWVVLYYDDGRKIIINRDRIHYVDVE